MLNQTTDVINPQALDPIDFPLKPACLPQTRLPPNFGGLEYHACLSCLHCALQCVLQGTTCLPQALLGYHEVARSGEGAKES